MLLGAVFGLLATAGFPAVDESPFRVLVIDSESADLPLWIEFRTSFKRSLEADCDHPVDVYYENLDFARFRESRNLDRAAAWVTEKYRDDPPDVVVTVGPETYRLMRRWPRPFATEASLVAVAVDSKTFNDIGRLPRSTALLRDFSQTDTVRLALELLPRTRRIAIVGGPADPQSYSHLFRSQILAEFAESFEIIDLSGLPLAEMRARAARLPDDTVLVLTAMAVDGAGRPFTHPEVVAELSPIASAPLFGSLKTELGHGSVGGHLFDPEISGRATAALVARILGGEEAASIEPRVVDHSVVAFDWRELDRWEIPARRLPQGSVIEFRPPTLWQEYRLVVMLTLGVIGFQAVSIVALLRSSERRREMNRELHRLSGRLITAQEDERLRLALDLHDDISQRLALLALELEAPDADRQPDGLSSKVQDLARDVHAIAHRLHPQQLENGGLRRELQAFCREVAERHRLRVECRVPESPVGLPDEIALALFRVGQEALQNAVRHSGADEVVVELGASPRWASITVSDNGCGLERAESTELRGLGFGSMRERVRLVGGWVNIDSVPEGGTTVSAWVPKLESPGGGADDPTAHRDR